MFREREGRLDFAERRNVEGFELHSQITPPFTGPRRTTFHLKTARSAAPCATACSAFILRLAEHEIQDPAPANVHTRELAMADHLLVIATGLH